MHILRLLILIIVATAFVTGAQAQKLYRWVDEDGNVTYSDKIPPDAVDHSRTELNEQGISLSEVERARTAEELVADAEARRIEEAERRRVEDQRNADETILRTYTSEDDITRNREAKLESIRRNIDVTESALAAQRKRMMVLRETAADHERAGEEVPKKLETEIVALGERIEAQRQFLNRRHGEMADVQEDYMEEIENYRAARIRLGYDQG